MRKFVKSGIFILVALVLTAAMAVPVLAQQMFSAGPSGPDAVATGVWQVRTGYETRIVEDSFDETGLAWTVHVENAEGSSDVYVRAKALCPSGYEAEYAGGPDGSGSWEPSEDGWCYFQDPVSGGQSTDGLEITFRTDPSAAVRKSNVVIVYEAVPVLYRGDGTPYADWSLKSEVWQEKQVYDPN